MSLSWQVFKFLVCLDLDWLHHILAQVHLGVCDEDGIMLVLVLLFCPFLEREENVRKRREAYHVIRDQLPSLLRV